MRRVAVCHVVKQLDCYLEGMKGKAENGIVIQLHQHCGTRYNKQACGAISGTTVINIVIDECRISIYFCLRLLYAEKEHFGIDYCVKEPVFVYGIFILLFTARPNERPTSESVQGIKSRQESINMCWGAGYQ